ncbi:hypothetical protein MUK42_32768 [Musa troglodytarum]|uniref:Uncharacterized protein n=1 Tax=Musa troglodytarum TaxID=320322 RepID=A0A9E7FEF3_9LILI|nr:hypothetical protein MUK42_32768 [Musa troglodytarum]
MELWPGDLFAPLPPPPHLPRGEELVAQPQAGPSSLPATLTPPLYHHQPLKAETHGLVLDGAVSLHR